MMVYLHYLACEPVVVVMSVLELDLTLFLEIFSQFISACMVKY